MSTNPITCNSLIQRTYKCTPCKTQPLDKFAYITHILGKRHQKNLKSSDHPQPNDEDNRTIHVTGFDHTTPAEAIIGAFLEYGVRNIIHHFNYSFVEFESADMVKKALKETHYYGKTRLQVSARHRKSHNQATGVELCKFLMHHFSRVFGFIFGSSANNLGFKGCDVDLYVDIGINPWASCYSKAESEKKASDVTFYLAREIKRSRVGIKVQAVARARVPIVKFQDTQTGLMVDLSFRHGMPVYNTQLIYQYSISHPLVRPYLMLIRYWAKIQGVAGGGQPTFLITNYALTMLMLFYLMSRDTPIIPSVAHLKKNHPTKFDNVISGWDCSFSRDMSEWSRVKHSVTVMELVTEFFTYYGKFEASKWVICPLAGKLIDKKALIDRDLNSLPPCMVRYCRQNVNIQLNTALCLQDPFENSHNCTRGLKNGPLVEFQYKCRKSAEICGNILRGKQSLSDFLKPIKISPEVLKEIFTNDPAKEVDQSIEEIITLDDSDDASQDSVEVINVCSEKKSKASVSLKSNIISPSSKDFTKIDNVSDDEEVIVVVSGNTREVTTKSVKHSTASSETSENGVGSSREETDEVSVILPEGEPENKPYKFSLNFSKIPEFSITFDGAVSGGKDLMTAADDIGQAACSLVHFALQQCLKVDVSVIEAFVGDKKRKSISQEENSDTGKRIKGADGESVPISTKYGRLAQYHCVAVSQLWVGRKQTSKKVPWMKNVTPLQFELAVTDAQVSTSGIMISSNSSDDSDKLDFMIELWQKCNDPSNILVTGDSRSSVKITRSQMQPMFSYLSSLSQNLLKKVMVYVTSTSSKR
nr:LOW QUALITY PROTEIN: speckle targeted PIP5K1A-regulated poly(A) polymerase-like [Cherax quadricarinatus]